jgi:hypothetical protein
MSISVYVFEIAPRDLVWDGIYREASAYPTLAYRSHRAADCSELVLLPPPLI